MSEHYSQTLNYVNGELKNLRQEENLKVLYDRVSMLEQLNNYANSMGEHSRRSRGLFFTFERFLLNYAFCFKDTNSDVYLNLVQKLKDLNTMVVLCMISPEYVEQRLIHRATFTNEIITNESVLKYIEDQQRFIDIANKTELPTMIVNTFKMNWDDYARTILNHL